MGNRWNNKTLLLPRPKVCKSPLPPKMIPRCVLSPADGSYDQDQPLRIEVLGWNEELDLGSEIEMTVETQKSTVEDELDPTNKNIFTGEFTLQNTQELGLDIVSVTLSFSDNSECTIIINVTWIEVEEP